MLVLKVSKASLMSWSSTPVIIFFAVLSAHSCWMAVVKSREVHHVCSNSHHFECTCILIWREVNTGETGAHYLCGKKKGKEKVIGSIFGPRADVI